MSGVDVLVVGGGVIGCAVAREAARGGARVTVLERDEPGTHASSAAAGMLTPLAEADEPNAFLDLLREGRALFPELAGELLAETGLEIRYRDVGTLLLALREADEAELTARHQWQAAAGLPVERLSADEVLRLEPAVSPSVRWGLRFPEDHQVDNRRMARALWHAAERAGAEVRLGAEAVKLLRDGRRVAGVELREGGRVAADTVVLAGGCWSGRLQGLPRPLPVHPVHGQLLALQTTPPLLSHVVDSPRGYLVPRLDGQLIVGTTVEHTGFHKALTPEGVMRILSGAVEMVPSLARQPIVDLWSGLRPGTPDTLPILGADPELHGLLYATGHYRNGILLAPITGRAIGRLALGKEPGVDLWPFRIDRF